MTITACKNICKNNDNCYAFQKDATVCNTLKRGVDLSGTSTCSKCRTYSLCDSKDVQINEGIY